jgi:DNA-binding MarR family transcriptional regulator
MATESARELRGQRESLEPVRSGPRPSLAPVARGSGVADQTDDVTVAMARRIYALRRRRDSSFGADLFSEPAWDILLHLYVAGAGAKPVTVSSARDGAAAPATTALRRLRQLEDGGWVVREGDPADARRFYVRLSSGATKKMRSLLTQAAGSLWEMDEPLGPGGG